MKNSNFWKTFIVFSTMILASCGGSGASSIPGSTSEESQLPETTSETTSEVSSEESQTSIEETSIEPATSEEITSEEESSEETSEEESSEEIIYNWDDDETLKILTIGNSFSDDSMQYVADIAKDLGVEKVKLGNLYIGGCSLATHAYNAEQDLGAYEYRTNTGQGWNTINNYHMLTAIESEDWDFISLQQNSGDSGLDYTYINPLPELIEFIQENASENAKIVWHMTWAYQQNSTHTAFSNYNRDQMTMYNAILDAVETQVLTKEAISMVIPVGTAIQNARTSYIGDTLTRDGYHLTMDFGRYIAGLTFVNKLVGLDISEIGFAPTGVDENYKAIAIESALNAVINPFEVTASEYDEEPAYDYSEYHLLDLDLTPLAYWFSQENTKYNILITDAANSKQFYASKRFTRLDIPVGSIIELTDGWQYRPEAWKDETKQASRPGVVSTKRVFVDEEWWGEYVYRAFNILKPGNPSLENNAEGIEDALKIYIPNNAEVKYQELNYDVIRDAFYDSTNATNYAVPITNNTSLSPKFYTTKRFTPEELPVGTILKIASGWQFRPEAWKDDAKQTSRPGNSTQEYTVITSSFWDGYIYRAFNVSKVGLPVISSEDITGVFQIFIPVE